METTTNVHLKPNAKRNEITGFKDNVLYVKVTTPPHKGAANKALLKLMATELSIPKTSIEILRGHTSRNKVVTIYGISTEDLKIKIDQILSGEAK